MKIYDCREKPIKVFGLPLLYTVGKYHRLPDNVMASLPSLREKGMRPNGGRICFRTDSKVFTIRARIKIAVKSETHSLLDTTGFVVYVGERQSSRYVGTAHMTFNSSLYSDRNTAEGNDMIQQKNAHDIIDGEYHVIEKTFDKADEMEDITIFMPGICHVDYCQILIEEDAKIEEPTPYKYPKPIVFYGSSITAGGATSRISNNYISLLSRWLDADYHNYGFAGGARGELEMADFLSSIEMSVLVMDYDHNAPDAEYLKNTHETFYKRFRSKQPFTPVLMMSKPDYNDYDDSYERREIINNTYKNAKRTGDNNVYFIDGESLFGEDERHACTVDLCHPNDYGFMKMAKTVYPVLREILENLK